MFRGKNPFLDPEIGRRDFLKLSTTVAAVLGLSPAMVPRITQAMESGEKPAVIWLHFQDCTGCTESLLRSTNPDLASVILDVISMEYHETLFAAAGHQIEEQLHHAMERYKDKYVLVVEGSIPTKDNEAYFHIGGRSAVEILKEAAAHCAAIIAIGSCATWGGIPSSPPNPTGAVGTDAIIKDKPIVNIPGCPPSPYNFLSTVIHYITFNKLPEVDDQKRPKFAYGRLIHDFCERRAHFDAGRFAMEYGDEGHRAGHCLYWLGCKGPATYANCPEIGFNRQKTWPVSIGHPCFGCTEQQIAFKQPLHDVSPVLRPDPAQVYADIERPENKPASLLAAGAVGAVVGGVAAYAAAKAKQLPNEDD